MARKAITRTVPAKRRTAWLALAAMLVYSLAPLLPTPAAAVSLVQICTAHGIVTMAIPDGDAPSDRAMADCLACALTAHGNGAGKTPLASVEPPAISVPFRTIALITPECGQRDGHIHNNAQPRAPPLPV